MLRLHLSHGRLAAAKNALQAETKKPPCIAEKSSVQWAPSWATWWARRSTTSEEIESHWQTFLDELDRLAALHGEFAEIERVTALIRQSGAPVWAQRLSMSPAAVKDDPEIPALWNDAWMWSRQRGYLEAIDGRGRIFQLNTERRAVEKDLARANQDLVEQLTWLQLREILDQDRGIFRTSVIHGEHCGYRRGTGASTPSLRQCARARWPRRSSVRCWIMPHWRISESFLRTGVFDLRDRDEASQSDSWAIPALLRAKNCLSSATISR